MIARAWHGAVRAKDAERYHAYLEATGLPDYRRTPGNRGVYVLRRVEGEVAHFLLLTLWESWDAIRAFAGDEPERARYYPEDEGFLLELEPTVTHYDVLGETDPPLTVDAVRHPPPLDIA
jgi:heme-degrading monooxygenase HmoA